MEESIETKISALLLATRGRKMGQRYDLSHLKASYIIGRDDDSCDVPINDDSVSREHCKLVWIDDDWFVEDLGSMNGTFVNGHRVDRAPLRNDDLIKAGGEIFRFLRNKNLELAFHGAIYRLAVYDGLTEIHNRRYFDEFLDREFSRAKRHGRNLALMLFDIDHFSGINERYGMVTGDHVLRSMAQKLDQRIRREELLARYSSACFALLLPDTTLEGSKKFSEIVRHTIEISTFELDGVKVPTTVSVGVGFYHDEMNKPEDLASEAESALFRAKRNGRNQVSL